jgi:hypothetical protein
MFISDTAVGTYHSEQLLTFFIAYIFIEPTKNTYRQRMPPIFPDLQVWGCTER